MVTARAGPAVPRRPERRARAREKRSGAPTAPAFTGRRPGALSVLAAVRENLAPMALSTLTPPRPAPAAPAASAPAWRRPVVHRRAPDLAAVLVGLGLGASVALPVSHASAQTLAAPGGLTLLLGDVSAMAGTYLLLVMVLLAARLPLVEAVVGQDRLLRWHRRLSPAPIALLGAHAVLTTLGFAQSGHVGLLSEAASLVTSMAWIFAALVAYAMLVAIAAASIRAARRRLGYDTWWVIHLYSYLALAFSVPHQIVSGTAFLGHPVAKIAWSLLWLSTAGVVLVYRLGLPIYRSLRHRIRVLEVVPESPGVYAVLLEGHHLESLPVAGGQYIGWRFLTRDLWWHAHPFSLSAMPAPPYLRVTVKVVGDATARIATLRPGTKVAIEGPYGAFTDALRTQKKVALIGAGVGITPLRALLQDLPPDVDVVVVQRASTSEQLVHRNELAMLAAERGGRSVELVGSRRKHRLDVPARLSAVVPDLATRDLYICGADAFAAGVVSAARALGVPAAAIHHESFAF